MERLDDLLGTVTQLGMSFPYRNKEGQVVGCLKLSEPAEFQFGFLDDTNRFTSTSLWMPWNEEVRRRALALKVETNGDSDSLD